MIDLDDLRSLVEVVESGGFNRAARRLGVSKSIVSRRIARLEADLGTRLLSRTTRGISPTEAGLEFKARGERILAELDEAREAVAQQAGVVGRLRLSAPLSFGVRHVAPVLAEMAQRHPRLELDVSYSDRIVDLIGERFDAAIRIGTLQDSSLVARRIAPVRAVLVASPDYLARHGRPDDARRPRRSRMPDLYGQQGGRMAVLGRQTLDLDPAGGTPSLRQRRSDPAMGDRRARHRRRTIVPRLGGDRARCARAAPARLCEARARHSRGAAAGLLCSGQGPASDRHAGRAFRGRTPLGPLPDERAWSRAVCVVPSTCRHGRCRPTLAAI